MALNACKRAPAVSTRASICDTTRPCPGRAFPARHQAYGGRLAPLLGRPTLSKHAAYNDPVCRSAIQNAASVSAMILTTESLVANIPEPPMPNMTADVGGMGGMGGMF